MDASRFDAALLSALGGATGLTQADREWAGLAAAVAYSRYRPLLRRVGDAQLAAAVAANATELLIVGGLPDDLRPGAAYRLDAGGFNEEEVTVQAVTVAAATGSAQKVAGTVLRVTLAAAVAGPHAAGTPLTPKTAASVATDGSGRRGLKVVAGRDTYRLPPDLVRPDRDSFDLAVGARSELKNAQGYYDLAYHVGGRQMASAGLGYSGNYGQSYPGHYPINGHPHANPNGIPGGAAGVAAALGGTVTYRFLLSSSLPQMVVSPAPADTAQGRHLDFYYWGTHPGLCTVPEGDADALLAYARYWGLNARATASGECGAGEVFGIKEDGAKGAQSLQAQAAAALAEFENNLHFVPHMISG